jgi:NmrA-like family
MPSIAIAGGASPSLGRSLVQGILTLAPHWKITILSRPSSSVPSWLSPILESGRANLRRVNYADHAALVSALRSVGAHTVISALGFTFSSSSDGSWFSTQIALLTAAVEAGVKRFAPSEFGAGVHATPMVEAISGSVRVWKACEEAGLEWTRYECGLFMNYLGFGVPSHGPGGEGLREEALSGREKDGEWFYYTSECRAELPIKADGTFPRITMTAIEDVGKFVAKSLDLPPGSWETTSYMVGETLRMDEVVRIAEKVMGKKWEVETVSAEELEARIEGLESKEDAGEKMWAQLALCNTSDLEGKGWLEGRLNGLFPDVRPLTVKGYFRRYYG